MFDVLRLRIYSRPICLLRSLKGSKLLYGNRVSLALNDPKSRKKKIARLELPMRLDLSATSHYKIFESNSTHLKSRPSLEANMRSRAIGRLKGGLERAQSLDLESRRAWEKKMYVPVLRLLKLADLGQLTAPENIIG